MGYLYYLLAFLFGLVCVLMMLLILIQKGRGGGLSSAFGGAGGNTAFGAKTGDMLTWVTAGFFVVFLILSCGMIWTTNYLHAHASRTTPVIPDETSDFPFDAGDDGLTPSTQVAPTSQPQAPATTEPAVAPATGEAPGEAQSPQ